MSPIIIVLHVTSTNRILRCNNLLTNSMIVKEILKIDSRYHGFLGTLEHVLKFF